MHTRRFLCLYLGFWLGCSAFLFFVATQNFQNVDRLLASPHERASKLIQKLGHEEARALLRYQVSELNRFYFEYWGMAQVGLAVIMFVIVLFGTREGMPSLILSLLMLIDVSFMYFVLTPQVASLGRALQFQSDASLVHRFWYFHSLYSGAEVGKLVMGLIFSAVLIGGSGRRRRGELREEVNPVHNADHSHVDG